MKNRKLPNAGWILIIAICLGLLGWLVRAMLAALP